MLLEDDDYAMPDFKDTMILPVWAYLVLFLSPAVITGVALYYYTSMEFTLVGVIALAVMNGSINSVIAWMTIRLDSNSAEALDHLDTIMDRMDQFDVTLQNANNKVESFTSDLDEARELFQRVGLNLEEIDLAPVADVVEKLKENKDGLNDILDNLREVDVDDYIKQAKRIEWKELLNGAEEIMGFIKKDDSGNSLKIPEPSIGMPKLPTLPSPAPGPTLDEIIGFMEDDDDSEFFEEDDTYALRQEKSRKDRLRIKPDPDQSKDIDPRLKISRY